MNFVEEKIKARCNHCNKTISIYKDTRECSYCDAPFTEEQIQQLFETNQPNQPKQNERTKKYLSRRGIDNLETNIDNQVRNIIGDLAGNNLFKTGMALSFAKAEEQAKVTYLSALTEQNWILIKQNDEMMKQNKEIINLLKNK